MGISGLTNGVAGDSFASAVGARVRSFDYRGRSSVWLERLPVTQEVASSSLVDPAINAFLKLSKDQQLFHNAQAGRFFLPACCAHAAG